MNAPREFPAAAPGSGAAAGAVAGAAGGAAGGDTAGDPGWRGRLALRYRRDGERTIGTDRHVGPLRVLKRLYPEGPGTCHHVLVHPPGGIVGGDRLEIDIEVGEDAHALVTTPGATRFYRSAGAVATQELCARVAAGGRLEWLPLETIAYRGAIAVNRMRFELAEGAQMIGWDLLALGLPAAGEPFSQGRFEQHLELPGAWLERGIVDPGDSLGKLLLGSPLGWDGQSALFTLWCAGGSEWPAPLAETLLAAARERLRTGPAGKRSGATAPHPKVVVVRALADRVEALWPTLQAIRDDWRRLLWASEPAAPRIWQT